MYINILGLKVNIFSSKVKIKEKIRDTIEGNEKKIILTINPEIILLAQNDEEYFYILNKFDLSICDGIGLKIASWFLGKNLVRFTGIELGFFLISLALEKKLKIGIIHYKFGLSGKDEIEKKLRLQFENLDFEIFEIDREEKIEEDFQYHNIDILLVSLGAPFQENFIYKNLDKFRGLKIAVGVGSFFDILTKKRREAPKIFSKFGFEWLFRLFFQKNFSRIYNATIKFSFYFLRWRFYYPFFYRKNIACLIYRKNNNSEYEILLTEREDEKGHWQIPQGGIDKREDFKEAAFREIKEELNLDENNLKLKKIFTYVFRYKFPKEFKRMGYRGQKQNLAIFEFLGDNKDIKISLLEHRNWKWVNEKDFIQFLHKIRQKSGKVFYEKYLEVK